MGTGVILGSLEHPRLGNRAAVELVNVDHPAEGDETDESVRWQSGNELLNGALKKNVI